MNIVSPVPTTRQLDFVVALQAAEISPYVLGALDAERGEMACPELYYVRRGQMCEYCEGYASVAGPTLTTRHFLGDPAAATPADLEATLDAIFAPVVDDRQLGFDLIDHDAEADDYEDYLADVEFFRCGC